MRRLLFLLMGLALLGLPAGASAMACSNEGLREQQETAFLSECRAYEMVSPVDKNGGDVMTSHNRIRTSVDGNTITYPSLTAFAEALGTNVTNEYVAQRTPEGWGTHGITPPQEPHGIFIPSPGIQTRLVGDLSDDLSTGIVYAVKPLTPGAPNVAHVPKFLSASRYSEGR